MTKTNDAFERTIEQPFIGKLAKFASQARGAFLANLRKFISHISPPGPIPASTPFAPTVFPMTGRVSTTEMPASAMAYPPLSQHGIIRTISHPWLPQYRFFGAANPHCNMMFCSQMAFGMKSDWRLDRVATFSHIPSYRFSFQPRKKLMKSPIA
jgi:hypothetical protein